MKMTFRSWRWSLPVVASLACGSPWVSQASAQQPISIVELAQPVEAEPQPLAAAALEGAQPAATDDPAPAIGGLAAADGAETVREPGVELVQERYPSGKIKIEREMVLDASGNYILHGSFKQFNESEGLVMEGHYVNNKKEGQWTRVLQAGDAPMLATAPYTEFAAPFTSQAGFKNGRLNGKWILTDSQQRKVHEIDFEAGERHGLAVFYYPSGNMMLQSPFEHGLVNGDVIDYSPDGTVTGKEHFEAGRKLSQKVEHFDAQKQSKKAETMILHAMLAAKSTDNYDTGELAVFEVRGQDEKHGPFTTWHSNGTPARKGEFKYNLPTGKFVFWYANGQKQMEGVYVEGQQQGNWSWWHENGQKSIGGDYKDGQPIGAWSWWKSNGKLSQKTDFSSGKAVPIAQTPTVVERTARTPANTLPQAQPQKR